MKAIVVRQPGGGEVLSLDEVPDPVPGAGWCLVIGWEQVQFHLCLANNSSVRHFRGWTVTAERAERTPPASCLSGNCLSLLRNPSSDRKRRNVQYSTLG